MLNKYTDLSIESGDIAVENGQFKIQSDEQLIQNAVIRRIKTPLNSYSVYVVNYNNSQIDILDADYGNLSYELTALDSQLVLEKLQDNLAKALELEPRISIQSITYTNDIIEGVNTVINYTIDDNHELKQTIIL